jgi:hypothetical protein
MTTGAPPSGDSGTTTGMMPGGEGGATTPPAAWGTPVAGGPTGMGTAAMVTVDPSTTVGTIGSGFAGLSYEKKHLTNGSLTSSNAALIALYKLLGSPVLRVGANDVNNCTWGGTGTAPAMPTGQPFTTIITTGMVDELCTFLAATGSRIIYGVNYRADDVTASAAEAAYVMSKCPSSVYGIEIGNEPGGTFPSIQTQWEAFATAITATPGALLIGPAAFGGDATFTAAFAAAESAKFGSKLVLLTQHYYVAASGTAQANAAALQTIDQNGVDAQEALLSTAAVTNKIPGGYRLGETNTFSGHGQAGVSDTLISGLWAIDLMFHTAKNGGSGVNFHGGETGMDGTKPFAYEPIMELSGVVVQAQPEFYGLLLFVLAGTGPMVSTTATTSDQYFAAYAIKSTGFTSVVLDNKDATNGISATVDMGSAVTSASAIYLQGPTPASLTSPALSVTLAGAQVMADGSWARGAPYIQTTSGNTVSVYVPPASAALVRVQ